MSKLLKHPSETKGLAKKINIELNVMIVSYWRTGTTKLGLWFNENGFLFLDEPYSDFYQEYHYPRIDPITLTSRSVFIANKKIDTWMLNMIRHAPVPVCIKIQLPHIYNIYERTTLIDKVFLYNCFPNALCLYRKDVHEIVTSNLLAKIKNAWTSQDVEKNKNYNDPVTIPLNDYIDELKGLYRQWSEYIYVPSFTANNEMWLTYEDDILPLQISKKQKPMPDKTKIIANWDELVNFYNENGAKDFNALTELVMDYRERTKDNWAVFKAKVENYGKLYKELEEKIT
jgi:hypothetical protein